MNAQKAYVPTILTILALAFAFAITLPAFAHADEDHGKTPKERMASSTMKAKKDRTATSTKKVDLTCMQTAVDARESALITAFTTYQTNTNTGLEARKSALNTAWGITEKGTRQTAVNDARKAWRESQEKALKTLKADRKSAWEKFKTTAKTSCKETLPKGEDTVEKETSGALTI